MREFLIGISEIHRQESRRVSFERRKHAKRPPTETEMGEAYQVERQIRREADMILGNQDKVYSIDPKTRLLIITGKMQLQKEGRSSSGADFEISITERREIGNIYYSWDTAYAFYRDRVNVSIEMIKGKLGKNSERGFITSQADTKDLTGLLKILRGSKPAR